MIEVSKVSKKFGDFVALDEIDFQIKPEEFAFIIGPSGAGKTTLIKLILREILPSSGEIKVDGFDLAKLGRSEVVKLRRKVGVVFQDLKLLHDRTVFENVAMILKIMGRRETEIKKEVENVLNLVGLAERTDQFPSQLAGGELQRVCIARAVVAKPDIVIADEPTGNLDPATAWQIVELLQEIHRLGKTVVMATHNFEIVNSLNERVIELGKGKVVSDEKKGKYRVK
ncbi:cell division ATP-binding protein FtsE [Patescibacteria group bacterium]